MSKGSQDISPLPSDLEWIATGGVLHSLGNAPPRSIVNQGEENESRQDVADTGIVPESQEMARLDRYGGPTRVGKTGRFIDNHVS